MAGGRSNISLRVADDRNSWVLRRPPAGNVLPTAHDVSREYRVQKALSATPMPVPEMRLYCDDLSVIGAPFYVMDFVAGTILRNESDSSVLTPAEAGRVAVELVDVLVTLHSLDPKEVGLEAFGRPEGFIDRNLKRWALQFGATRTCEDASVDQLVEVLQQALPISGAPAIIHGDYRLDNVVLAAADPGHIQAVLDWEMSTLGDPLADVGLLLAYWDDPGGEPNPLTHGQTAVEGFPAADGVAALYASRTDRDLAALDWYVAFGCFKVFVVIEGLLARTYAGDSPGADLAELRQASAVFLERAHEAVAKLS